eukprot:gene1382-32749_t
MTRSAAAKSTRSGRRGSPARLESRVWPSRFLSVAATGEAPPMDSSAAGWDPTQMGADAVSRLLANDLEFSAAVKKHDVKAASSIAAKIVKAQMDQLSMRSPMARMGQGDPYATPAPQGDGLMDHSHKSADLDALGQEGVVSKVDPAGWVDIHLPKLGRCMRLQQRFLSPQQPANAGGVHSRILAAGTDSFRTPMFEGTEEMNRTLKHSQSAPGDQANYSSGERGVTCYKEIAKAVQMEMLSLEENVPWNSVDAAWKGIRPSWRKSLKNLGEVASRSAPEVMIPLLAASMLELNGALLTDKGPVSWFAKGGQWDLRLHELAEGGNNPLALQQLWEDMSELVRSWLAGQGQGQGRQSYSSVYRAFSALDAAADKGDSYMQQPILGSNRESFDALRGLVENEKHYIMSRIDAVGQGGSDPEAKAGCLSRVVSPALYSELQSLHTINTEVDTDVDDGPDATDMDTDTDF